MFKKKDSGYRCEVDANGVRRCKIFDQDKDGKVSTGTDVSFTLSESCEPIMQGAYDIRDKDEGKVKKIIEQHVNACKKGLA